MIWDRAGMIRYDAFCRYIYMVSSYFDIIQYPFEISGLDIRPQRLLTRRLALKTVKNDEGLWSRLEVMLTWIPGGNQFHDGEDMKIHLKLQKSGNSPVLRKGSWYPIHLPGFFKFQWQFQVVGNGISFFHQQYAGFPAGWENPKAGCDLCKGICPSHFD